jgi:hypothetical protein
MSYKFNDVWEVAMNCRAMWASKVARSGLVSECEAALTMSQCIADGGSAESCYVGCTGWDSKRKDNVMAALKDAVRIRQLVERDVDHAVSNLEDELDM